MRNSQISGLRSSRSNNSRNYEISIEDRRGSLDSNSTVFDEIKDEIMSAQNSRKTNSKMLESLRNRILLPTFEDSKESKVYMTKRTKPKKTSSSNLSISKHLQIIAYF